MNTFDLSSLRSKGPVKAGIYAQAAIKRGYCYSQNIYPKTCYYDFLTGSLSSPCLKFCVFISNMTGLFEDVSRIIFSIIQDFYNESEPAALKTASVVSYQSFGDLLRFNPHWHCIILEGGIDENNSFHYLPIKDTLKLTEVFRQRVIKYFPFFYLSFISLKNFPIDLILTRCIVKCKYFLSKLLGTLNPSHGQNLSDLLISLNQLPLTLSMN